jgi:hypothetical protein
MNGGLPDTSRGGRPCDEEGDGEEEDGVSNSFNRSATEDMVVVIDNNKAIVGSVAPPMPPTRGEAREEEEEEEEEADEEEEEEGEDGGCANTEGSGTGEDNNADGRVDVMVFDTDEDVEEDLLLALPEEDVEVETRLDEDNPKPIPL